MTEIKAYKTIDGKVFDGKADAIQHEKYINLFLDVNGLLDKSDIFTQANRELIRNFIDENAAYLKRLLDIYFEKI